METLESMSKAVCVSQKPEKHFRPKNYMYFTGTILYLSEIRFLQLFLKAETLETLQDE